MIAQWEPSITKVEFVGRDGERSRASFFIHTTVGHTPLPSCDSVQELHIKCTHCQDILRHISLPISVAGPERIFNKRVNVGPVKSTKATVKVRKEFGVVFDFWSKERIL
jgi:hypothetical protein